MRRARGVTLVEILISLAVVLIGMLALFRTLAVSVIGSGMSSRIGQAQLRAASIIESIRLAPSPAILCLATTPASGWSACEVTCVNNQLGIPVAPQAPQACVYTTSNTTSALRGPSPTGAVPLPSTDRTGQIYSLVSFNAPELAPDGTTRTSFVQPTGPGNKVYDIQITIGWNDDGSPTVTNPAAAGQHFVTLRTAVAVLP